MKKRVSEEKQQNIFKRLLTLMVTAALIFGGLFLALNWDRYNLDALKRHMMLREIETGISGEAEPFTHGGGNNFSAAYLPDGLIMASSTGVRYYTFSGKQYSEHVVPMEHPVVTSAGGYAVAYDAGGTELWLYHGGEEVFSHSLEGELLSVRPNESGWLAVTSQESGYKGSVIVYNAKYEPVFRLNRSSTFVVDAMVSPDGKRVAVITIGQTEGRFSSRLLVFRLDSEEPEREIPLGNMAVLEMEYEKGQLWVAGENTLVRIPTDTWTSDVRSFGHSYLKGVSFGGNGFAMVMLGHYRVGSADQVLIVDADGTEYEMTPNGQVLDYDAAGGYVCLLSSRGLNIYTKDLDRYRSMEQTQNGRYVALSDNASAMLASRQQAWMYIPG